MDGPSLAHIVMQAFLGAQVSRNWELENWKLQILEIENGEGHSCVIPAEAGIYNPLIFMDSCFRRNNKQGQFSTFSTACATCLRLLIAGVRSGL